MQAGQPSRLCDVSVPNRPKQTEGVNKPWLSCGLRMCECLRKIQVVYYHFKSTIMYVVYVIFSIVILIVGVFWRGLEGVLWAGQ